MRLFSILFVLTLSSLFINTVYADTLVDKYLASGELVKGEKALKQHLKANPNDDQARFGLGVLQTMHAVQSLTNNVIKAGLRTSMIMDREPRDQAEKMMYNLLKEERAPKKLTYAGFRQIFQTFVDDLNDADATLAAIKDAEVKLPLHLGKVQLSPLSGNTRIRVGVIGLMIRDPLLNRAIGEDAVIVFDRGDVCWLRGYCNALAGISEIFLALDSKQLFDVAAHRAFNNVDTPHTFLLEEPNDWGRDPFFGVNRFVIIDAIASIHSTRFPLQEPKRMGKALKHFETTLAMSKEMWTHYLDEDDDDNEWIPSPKQTGALGIPVSQKQLAIWLEVVAEAERVLQGKKLLPFWRGTNKNRGINLRKVFTDPQTVDVILWIQGTGATPYLEEGTITDFADVDRFNRMDRAFGGWFVGFGFWFN